MSSASDGSDGDVVYTHQNYTLLLSIDNTLINNNISSGNGGVNWNLSNANCWEAIVYGSVVPQIDNDISGIGVVVAFMLSAYLTYAVVLASYFRNHVDENLLRPLDTLVFGRRGRGAGHESSWSISARYCVLALSDQQIVTGVAILTAGFARFTTSMSVYHWQMVIYLAWMSSSVHLTALTMMANFLRERRLLLSWRIFGMMVLFVMLLVALMPTSSNYWAIDNSPDDTPITGWAVPAQCFWMRTYGQGVNPDTPIGIILLTISYAWKVGAIFQSCRSFFHTRIRGPVEYWQERWLQHEARRLVAKRKKGGFGHCRLRYRAAMSVYALTLAHYEFFSSFAASLYLSLGGLAWGTLQIIVPRIQNLWWSYQENTWTFGQIVPLVLLVQPIGAILEHLGEGEEGHNEEGDEESPPSSHKGQHTAKARRASHASTGSGSGSNNRTTKRAGYLDVFAQLDIRQPCDRSVGDIPGHQRLLYRSRFFKSLFYLIQVEAILMMSLIFVQDAFSIGNDVNQSWFDLLSVGPGFLILNVLWCLLFMPWSRIYR